VVVKKKKPGPACHKPNDKTRMAVLNASAKGMTQDEIAAYMGMTTRTLRKYYQLQLREGKYDAVMKVADKIFAIALDDNPATRSQQLAASIFILKTQAGWREVNRTEITGKDGGAIQLAPAQSVLDPRDMSVEARQEFRALVESKLAEIEHQDIIDVDYSEVEDD
jgi:transcriptional regulator with XRE-family HTH domain